MSMQQSDRPLAIDLYAGLGGWSEGLLAEGFRVVGFDIEQHQYGEHRYPAQLVIQDVRTLHGSQFKGAAVIVASPPCQEFSYMAMPWGLAKAKRAAILADKSGDSLVKLTELFDACFRIQKEASEAAGHHIPLIVENVRGAQEWVGRARWSFGSFYLWGDVPALMPMTSQYGHGPGVKRPGRTMCYPAGSANPDAVSGRKGKLHWQDESGIKVGNAAGYAKVLGQSEISRKYGSKSPQRKMASAMIAKIPTVLSRHIASTFMPK